MNQIIQIIGYQHQSKWFLFPKLQAIFCKKIMTKEIKRNVLTTPIISTTYGKLQGSVERLDGDQTYFSFKGIPYAEPPVGKLRFAPPQPPKPWSNVRDATEHGNVCPHMDYDSHQKVYGNEDCLFLNVYTKSLEPVSKKPVMFYIHGGGFMYGSGDSDIYGPEYLLQHDVVLVTINYRLELFGFLCLDIPEVPGNAGLKDQVAALQWVQNNIEQFGGDPKNVTIFGESAGGCCVTYHLISDISKGLFSKAITQSGVCLNYWGYNTNPRERASRIAKYFGIENDPQKIYKHLLSVPAQDFINLTYLTLSSEDKVRDIPIYFTPVIEKKFSNIEPYLCRDTMEALVSKSINRIPIMIGYNECESQIRLRAIVKFLDEINKNPSYTLMPNWRNILSKEAANEMGQRIFRYYLGKPYMDIKDKANICEMESDKSFNVDIHRFTYYYSQIAPTYMYKFNFDTEINLLKKIAGVEEVKGPNHADDLFYLFKNNATNDIIEEKPSLKHNIYVMTKLWTDFAKTGNPTPEGTEFPEWKPYTKHQKEYYNISDELKTGYYCHGQRIEFWNKLFKEVGLPYFAESKL